MVLEAGLTERVAGEAPTPLCVTPSDQITVQGPVPVSAAWIVVELPAQICAVPETAAVGFGLTVMAALPEEVPVQLASVTDVTV